MMMQEETGERGNDDEIGRSSSSSSSSERGSGGKKKTKRKMMKTFMWPFRRLKAKESWRWRWRFLGSAFKWKRVNFQLSFFDDVVFKIVSVFEAVVLVATLCFFYMCCGCHF